MRADLAVIIPTHEKTDALVEAMDSVFALKEKPHLIVVGPEDVLATINEKRAELCTLVAENDNTSYANLVNKGIEAARTIEDTPIEWITILEHDDKLLPFAGKLFDEYTNHFTEESFFAGLTLIVSPENRENGGNPPALEALANDAAWAPNVMETPGLVDFNAMLRMNFVLLNACFFKLSMVDEIGMLKTNMKHFSDYEFILRAVYNGYNIRAIPKATHYHYSGGKATQIQRQLDSAEGEFWVSAARKEYFFEFDRELVYEPVSSE